MSLNFKKMIGLFIYKSFAQYLPISHSYINIGQKQIRALCGKLILEKCGKNINIERKAVFSIKVQLGNNSGIGVNASLGGTVIIGDNVMMGPNCTIYTSNHRTNDLTIPMCKLGHDAEKPVIIGDDVWIGGNVIILPGVHIGCHSIIGAGSVVTKNVPDYALFAGNPATLKKMRR